MQRCPLRRSQTCNLTELLSRAETPGHCDTCMMACARDSTSDTLKGAAKPGVQTCGAKLSCCKRVYSSKLLAKGNISHQSWFLAMRAQALGAKFGTTVRNSISAIGRACFIYWIPAIHRIMSIVCNLYEHQCSCN